MTHSYTRSLTFTRTNAEYLASKLAADLRQMQLFYGHPPDAEINQYIQEAIILLLGGWLKSVSYGYKRNGNWVIALKYETRFGVIKPTDDDSGMVTPGIDISGAFWHSFLSKNHAYSLLPQSKKNEIEQLLPIKRTYGIEPRLNSGGWRNDKYYSSSGGALQRQIYHQ